MKTKFREIFFLFLGLSAGIHAQAQSGKDVLFTVGDEPVTVEEFKYIYEKNNANGDSLYDPRNVKEYLDLYTNFKLKVKEAKEEGLDTTAKFLKEYNNYRNQLAQPYLTDRNVTQSLIDEAYNRLQTELRVSHILIPISADASPKDTLAAYNKAMELRQKAVKGEDFAALARANSKDPSVANNGGDLGYFTAFQMIYPFESAAYGLKDIGDISMPVRTRYGYHILKLTGKRPYRGEIQVRHILINSSSNDSKDKQQMAKNKIDSLYSQLQKGANFAELARQFSDHMQSRQNGGELPPFNSFAQYPEEFKDAAFALNEDGSFSKPFHTQYGWHLVQRISQKGLQSKKEMEEYLKQKIAKDSRSEKSKEAAISRFKQEYNFTEKKKVLKRFAKLTDTSLLSGNWKLDPSQEADLTMFTLDGKCYAQRDFAKYLQDHEKAGRYTDKTYAISQYYNDFVDETVMTYQDQNLENKYPDFRHVAKEYREGIMLFDITDRKVWNKAMTDTAGLKEFYEKNKDKYKWGPRADAVIVDLRDKDAVPAVKKQLAAGKSAEDIANSYVKKDPLSLNYKEGLYEKGESKILDKVDWKPGVYEAGLDDGRYYVVKINAIKAPEYKKLMDIRGLVIADYQDYLEKEWIKSLKAKYPVKVNEQVLSSLKK